MSAVPVLVVDDEPEILVLLEAVLQAEGFDPVPCARPEEAADLAAERVVRAVVLDVMMPGLDGFQVLEQLRARESTRGLPVLMLSAKAAGPDRVRGLEAGADDYLIKPFEPEELVIRLRRLVERASSKAVTLEGALGRLASGDVLQQLLASGMEGVLEVDGEPPGSVMVGGGRILEATCGPLEGESALFVLLDRRGGRFRFLEQRLEREAEQGLRLQGALMHLAWLEDELERRHHLLPARDAPLKAREGSPPEGECRLLDAVYAWLRAHPGGTLADLEKEIRVAPQQAAVALTMLREAGLVEAGDGTRTDVAAEAGSPAAVTPRMEAAARRLASLAVAMRQAPGVVHVLVAVTPTRWDAFLREVLGELPPEMVVHSPSHTLQELEQRGSSSLRLRSQETTVLVHIHRLAGLSGLRARAFLPMASVVVVAPESPGEPAFLEIVAAAEQLDRPPEGVVVLPESGLGEFEPPQGWRPLGEPPRNLVELLEAL